MSSGTVTPPPLQAGPKAEPAAYEVFIEQRIRQARRQVKGVDIAGGLVILLIGTLAYLLVAVVIDHWVVSGGLGPWGRALLWLGLLVGAGYCFAIRVVMPLVYRINPIFAAHTIEQSRPSLKNSLINFLLLRGHRREVPQPVYRAIEQRAAADLSTVPPTMDLSRIILLLSVLAATVFLGALYWAVSPKNPFLSAGRVIWPWADITPPTRVTIEDVKPGDAVRFHGEHVTVSGKVRVHRSLLQRTYRLLRGRDATGSAEVAVAIYYSTADGQAVDEKIPVALAGDGYRHECKIPLDEFGLQQDTSYYLAAGDHTTRRFTIHVQNAPTILVDRVEYDYPAYTGFPNRTVKRQGDIRAIEGTEVTIHAAANRKIDRGKGAKIDLGCGGLREVDMRAEGKTATGSFILRLDPDDPTLPEHDTYQLRFRDEAGRLNPRPTRHRIEVIRDLPPDVQLIDPPQEEVQLVEGGRLEIRVRAEDPDFALRRVVLRAECEREGGGRLVIPPLLDELHQGEFQGSYLFDAGRAKFEGDSSRPVPGGLKAGDRVRYWAEAEDNKEPVPGRATTAQQWITIVEPPSRQPPPEQPDGAAQDAGQRSGDGRNQPPERQPGEDQQPQKGGPQDPAEKPQPEDKPTPREDDGSTDPDQQPGESGRDEPGQQGDPSQPGEDSSKSESGTAGQDRQPPDGQSDQPGEPIDPKTQPGDAIEKILEHREQQQKEKGEQETREPQPGEKGSGGEKSGEPQPGEKGSGGEKSGEPQPGEKGSGGEKSGEPQPSDKASGGEKSGEPQPGEKGSGGEKSGEPQPGEKGSGGEKSGEPQPGEKASGGEKSGEPQVGREPDSQQSPGGGEPSSDPTGPPESQGQNLPREKKTGQPGENPGEKQPADSPSISRHDSDSPQGDTSGDRSGSGEKGGGQRAKQPGAGADGSQTEADDGGSAGKQPGEGETGNRSGNQVETDQQTGSSKTQGGGRGSDGRRQPGGAGPGERQSEGNDPGGAERPQNDPSGAGQPGDGVASRPNARGQGNPTGGGRPGQAPGDGPPPQSAEPGGDDPNLEYARKATDLALEHLKDQMKQEDSELLDRLGWGPEEAEKFLKRWEQMKRDAAQEGPEGEDARRQLDGALKSLGLRPGGTQIRGGGTETDRLRQMREAGRFDPPSDWSELFRAYTRGVTGGGRR